MNLFGLGRRLPPATFFHTDAHGCDLGRVGCVFASSAPAAPAAPAPARAPRTAPMRPRAGQQPAITPEPVVGPRTPFAGLPAPMGATVAAALARTPPPAPRPRSSHAPTAERTDDLLSMTPLGRDALRLRDQRERDAAARRPAPISAEVRAALGATSSGLAVLAERARLDPTGEAQAAGLDPARRRELLEGSTLGRAMLAEEARHPRRVGEE